MSENCVWLVEFRTAADQKWARMSFHWNRDNAREEMRKEREAWGEAEPTWQYRVRKYVAVPDSVGAGLRQAVAVTKKRKKTLMCDDCLQSKEDVVATNCPYDEDVNGKITPLNLCDNCYHERAQDI